MRLAQTDRQTETEERQEVKQLGGEGRKVADGIQRTRGTWEHMGRGVRYLEWL